MLRVLLQLLACSSSFHKAGRSCYLTPCLCAGWNLPASSSSVLEDRATQAGKGSVAFSYLLYLVALISLCMYSLLWQFILFERCCRHIARCQLHQLHEIAHTHTKKKLLKESQSLCYKSSSYKDLKWLHPFCQHHKEAVVCVTVRCWLKELKQKQACKWQGFPSRDIYNEGQQAGPWDYSMLM